LGWVEEIGPTDWLVRVRSPSSSWLWLDWTADSGMQLTDVVNERFRSSVVVTATAPAVFSVKLFI